MKAAVNKLEMDDFNPGLTNKYEYSLCIGNKGVERSGILLGRLLSGCNEVFYFLEGS